MGVYDLELDTAAPAGWMGVQDWELDTALSVGWMGVYYWELDTAAPAGWMGVQDWKPDTAAPAGQMGVQDWEVEIVCCQPKVFFLPSHCHFFFLGKMLVEDFWKYKELKFSKFIIKN